MRDIFLLDMDDTLLDFEKAERAGVYDTFRAVGLEANEEVAERFHAINDGLWKALERGEITRERIVYVRFEMLFAEYAIACDAHRAAEIYFEALASHCYPFAGMEDFLRKLKQRGRVYIVTNGSEYIQRRHLQDGGILPYCDGVFISEVIGHYKPSAEFCDYVRAHVPAFESARAVYFGDSLTADKVCAERLGALFIRFLPRGRAGEGIASYDEFWDLL